MSEDISWLKPRPFQGWHPEEAVAIPMDTPSGLIQKSLVRAAEKQETTILGPFFLVGKRAVHLLGMGSPVAVMGLERLIASGAGRVVLLGFCGALKQELSLFDVVCLRRVHSEEGTSRHYLPEKTVFSASPRMMTELLSGLKARGLDVKEAVGVSTDAPFRETQVWVEEKKRQGIAAVDMEASAVLALAEFCGIPAACLMIVSDVFSEEGWTHGFRRPELDARVREVFLPLIIG
ncbi:MAG: hypothetical protein ACE5LV_01320 [Candidatus Aminicenantales bacterium]